LARRWFVAAGARAALTLAGETGIEAGTMNHRLFILSLGALLTSARAELPVDLPPDTPTNRPGAGISVPAPLRTEEPTNTVVIPPAPKATLDSGAPFKRVPMPVDGGDSLTFTNGDQFAGTFAGFEGDVIRWQSPISNEPIRFRTTGLDEVALAPRAATKGSGTPGWLVLLADGNLWPARQVTVETGHVVADLAHAGQVRLERQHVAWLRRGSELVTLGDAPSYAPSYAPSPNDYGQAMRYRDTKLPDSLLLEFPWNGDEGAPSSLLVFAGKPENLNRACGRFLFDFFQGCARVVFITDEAGGGMMATLSGPITNRTARPIWVGLAVNRKSGELALYLDGQLQRRGMLIAPLNVPDFGLAVAGSNPRSVVVSRLNDDLNLPAPPADQDAVRLANSDRLAGKLESVTTNEFVIQAATGRVVLPLERLAQISFARGAPVAPRADEVLVALHDGTVVRGVWQRADAQGAVVQHAVLGPVTVPRTLLAAVDYQPDPVMNSGRDWFAQRRVGRWEAWGGGFFTWRFTFGLGRLYDHVQKPGLIHLQPDNLWHGDLLAITNGIVRWQHPAALEPFALPLADVQRICPLPRPLPAASVADRATVVLANGDVISGPLAPGQDDAVRVTPWYVGPLAIPRRQVARLTPHAPVPDALRWDMGLTDGALWTVTTPPTGPLPDRLRLDVEAVWGERSPAVSVKFYQDEHTYLSTTFQLHGIRLTSQVAKQSVSTNTPGGALTNLALAGCATVTILADRANRHLRLLVDGHPAGEWRGPHLAALSGQGLSIAPGYGTGGALRHIVLREWREDPVLAPAQRLAAPAARTPADARVILHNGDFLTLSDIAADAQTLSGRHALLGPVALNLAAVRSLSWERPPGGVRAAMR
jgi:hypothetical protein